jgi:tight adherence protein B
MTVEPRVLVSSVGVAVATALVSMAATGIPGLSLAVGALVGTVPAVRASSATARAQWDRLRKWPDILAHVRSGLASGTSLVDAFVDALDRAEGSFDDMADVIRREALFGGGLPAAADALRAAGVDPTTQRVLVMLDTASRTGGRRVGEVVGAMSRAIADDIRLREAHHAALAEQRTTVGVALVAPWAMLVLAVATNPQAADAFSTPAGNVVVAIGAAATALGWLLARRAARLTTPPEVFE